MQPHPDPKMHIDPRDGLSKTRRRELVQIAHANGYLDITEDWPADGIRWELRKRGITKIIPVPRRKLGSNAQERTFPPGKAPSHAAPPAASGNENVEVDATEDLMRQWKEQQNAAPPPSAAPAVETKPIEKMAINELRKECQRLNVPMGRRDNTESLRTKVKAALNG